MKEGDPAYNYFVLVLCAERETHVADCRRPQFSKSERRARTAASGVEGCKLYFQDYVSVRTRVLPSSVVTLPRAS